jgi:hypothetical protein
MSLYFLCGRLWLNNKNHPTLSLCFYGNFFKVFLILLKGADVLKLNCYWFKGFRKPLVFSSSIVIGLKDLESRWCSQARFLLV